MTREEAIEYLDGMKIVIPICNELKELTDERNTAIDMAIEALSAKPQTDLISRADAIEAVCKGCHWWSGQCDNDKAFRCDEVCRIEALPSADAVQGEWIRKEREYNDCDGHYAYYWYECSVCGARPPKNQWKNEWHSDYCPSCGATMKGGAE